LTLGDWNYFRGRDLVKFQKIDLASRSSSQRRCWKFPWSQVIPPFDAAPFALALKRRTAWAAWTFLGFPSHLHVLSTDYWPRAYKKVRAQGNSAFQSSDEQEAFVKRECNDIASQLETPLLTHRWPAAGWNFKLHYT